MLETRVLPTRVLPSVGVTVRCGSCCEEWCPSYGHSPKELLRTVSNVAKSGHPSITRFTVGCWLFPVSLVLTMGLLPGFLTVLAVLDILGFFPKRGETVVIPGLG